MICVVFATPQMSKNSLNKLLAYLEPQGWEKIIFVGEATPPNKPTLISMPQGKLQDLQQKLTADSAVFFLHKFIANTDFQWLNTQKCRGWDSLATWTNTGTPKILDAQQQLVSANPNSYSDGWLSPSSVFWTSREYFNTLPGNIPLTQTFEFLKQLQPTQTILSPGLASSKIPEPALCQPTVFLDRDGVLVEDRHYAYKTQDMLLIPECIDFLQWVQKQGWKRIVVSNQSGIARGYFNLQDLKQCQNHIRKMFLEHGITFDLWYNSPYHPDGIVAPYAQRSLTRKPFPGMMMLASQKLPIATERSIMIGDKTTDLINFAGIKSYLLQTEKNQPEGSLCFSAIQRHGIAGGPPTKEIFPEKQIRPDPIKSEGPHT